MPQTPTGEARPMTSRVFNRPDLDTIVAALSKPSALVELACSSSA